MKYKVLSPIKHDGKVYPVGSEITFKDEPTKLLSLLEFLSKEEPEKEKIVSKENIPAKPKEATRRKAKPKVKSK